MGLLLARGLASTSLLPMRVPMLVRGAALASRPAVQLARSVPPMAFDGGDLSLGEVRGLLKMRGVAYDEAVADNKNGLLSQLEQSAPSEFLTAEEQRVETFERASPSVAFIQTSIDVPRPMGSAHRMNYGAGSGFVWDDAGHVITNYHVVAGLPGVPGMGSQRRGGRGGPQPKRVMVSLQGCTEPLEATVVGVEADKDLAVLKVDPEACAAAGAPLRPLPVASSAGVRVGQSVLAVGNPFGLDFTLTTGIVSALGRDVDGAGGRPIKDCVQTDAAIDPGNSGGPLLDSQGKLIGMNTMIYSPGGLGANVGIGFAIPVDTIRRIVNQILTFGPNARPSLGVSILPDQLRTQYSRGLKRKLEGAVITEVVPGSPADELGLDPCKRQLGGILLGDMITAVNGQPVKQNEDLLCAVEESEPANGPITLTVMRGCDDSRIEEVEITPVPRKELVAE